jgi:hypothetical protein
MFMGKTPARNINALVDIGRNKLRGSVVSCSSVTA